MQKAMVPQKRQAAYLSEVQIGLLGRPQISEAGAETAKEGCMKTRQYIVTVKEERTYRVEYFVNASSTDEARRKVDSGNSHGEEAYLESVGSRRIISVEDNK